MRHGTSSSTPFGCRVALALAIVLLLCGAVCFLAPFGTSEKPGAVYVYGHWVDVPWEIGFPLLFLGGVVALSSLLCRGLQRVSSHGGGERMTRTRPRAQRVLVERFLEWNRVRERLQLLPAIRAHFTEELLRSFADSAPYYCHYLAWRLGTWSSEDIFKNFDRLLSKASGLPGWESEFRSFPRKREFGTFWSLLWQLQVAAYFVARGGSVCWNSAGPDLEVTKGSARFYVECYSYQKSFGIKEFAEELFRQLDQSICVEHVGYLPFSLPQDRHTDDFLDELFRPYLEADFLEQKIAEAAIRWPVALPVPEGIRNFSVYLEGENTNNYMPDGVSGLGDPDIYLEQAVTEVVKQKRDSNKLRSHRPNVVAINCLLSHDFEMASAWQQRLGRSAPGIDLGDSLDAVILACCGVDGQLSNVKLLARDETHPATELADSVELLPAG